MMPPRRQTIVVRALDQHATSVATSHPSIRCFDPASTRLGRSMSPPASSAFTLSQLSALARAQNDLLTSDSALAASREATAFLEGILNATKDCVIVLALDGTLAFMNAGGQAIMEIDDFAMVEGSPWPALWEEEY